MSISGRLPAAAARFVVRACSRAVQASFAGLARQTQAKNTRQDQQQAGELPRLSMSRNSGVVASLAAKVLLQGGPN